MGILKRIPALDGMKFERDMILSALGVLLCCLILMALGIDVSSEQPILLGVSLLFVCAFPLILYCQESGHLYLGNAISVLYFGYFFGSALRFPVFLACHIGASQPLYDDAFIQFERAIHLPIPSLMAWGDAHWLGRIANQTYAQIGPFLTLALLLPALLNRAENSKRFIKSILLCFAIGLVIYIAMPVVGPYYGYHFGTDLQQGWQEKMLQIRAGGTHMINVEGVVGFPSFHVVWAILCAMSLWTFKPLRVPAAIFAGLIVLSTLTEGQHYILDVVSGIALAPLTWWLAGKWAYANDAIRSQALSVGLVANHAEILP